VAAPASGVLEREPWAAVTVAPEFQRCATALLARGAAAASPPAPPAACANGAPADRPAAQPAHSSAPANGEASPPPAGEAGVGGVAGEAGGGGGGGAADGGGGVGGGAADALEVGGRRFGAVGALLMLLRLLGEYLALGDAAPALAGELAHRVVELLKARPRSPCAARSAGRAACRCRL